MKIKKSIQYMYQKNVLKKNINLLLIGEKGKGHYVLIKDFDIFMYDHTLHHGKKLCRYCSQAFSIGEILKRHIKDCFKINGKQRIVIP